MIRLLTDTMQGVKAVGRALSFREDWAETLDLSASGLVRSFFAAIVSLPILVFVLLGLQQLNIDNIEGFESRLTALDLIGTLARIWLVFPVLAIFLTRLTGTKHRFVHWVVLHNWAVVVLLMVPVFPVAFYLLGLTSAAGVAFSIGFLYEGFRYFVHFRVAQLALGLPLLWTIPIAMIPVIVNMVLAYGLN